MEKTHFAIIIQEQVPDGMGGYILSDNYRSISAFEAIKIPLTVEKTLEEHGIVSTKAYKLFTRNYIPEDINLIRETYDTDKIYTVLQFVDYEKHKILLVEEVD